MSAPWTLTPFSLQPDIRPDIGDSYLAARAFNNALPDSFSSRPAFAPSGLSPAPAYVQALVYEPAVGRIAKGELWRNILVQKLREGRVNSGEARKF